MVVQSFRDDSKRERFLLVLFPSALILAVYSVMFAFNLRQQWTDAASMLAETKRTAVKPGAAMHAKTVLGNEKNSLEKLKDQLSLDRQAVREKCVGWRLGNDRLHRMGRLTEMMDYYNLSIVSQGGESGVVLSTYLQDLFVVMDQQDPSFPIKPWPVEVKGQYFNLLAFLSKVTEAPCQMIPVAVSMKQDAENTSDSEKTWTIIFMI